MISKLLSVSSLATACMAETSSSNPNQVSPDALAEFLQLYDASHHKRQSPIDIDTTNPDFATSVNKDEAFTANFSANVNYKDVQEVHDSFNFALEGEDLEFKTSLTEKWFPDTEPISFTPAQFHFHKGKGEKKGKFDNGSEHTLNAEYFDLEMHIVNLNLNKETQEKFLGAVVGILFQVDDDSKNQEETFADKFFHKLFHNEKVNLQDDFVKYLDLNSRYVYRGSLTTPPYSEPILWNMLPEVVKIRPQTLAYFGDHEEVVDNFNDEGENIHFGASNRDLNPINGRKIFKVEIHEDEKKEEKTNFSQKLNDMRAILQAAVL